MGAEKKNEIINKRSNLKKITFPDFFNQRRILGESGCGRTPGNEKLSNPFTPNGGIEQNHAEWKEQMLGSTADIIIFRMLGVFIASTQSPSLLGGVESE